MLEYPLGRSESHVAKDGRGTALSPLVVPAKARAMDTSPQLFAAGRCARLRRGSGRRVLTTIRYGVPIPISFSAASIRSGGAILIASALAGLQQALQAGEDRGPARASAGQDVVADVAVMRLQHRQLDRVARLLDLVGHERRPELFHQRRPVHVPGDGQLLRRIAFDHLAADMHRAVGRAGDEGAADFQVGLDRKAGKILAG